MRRARIAGVAEPLDQAMILQPLQMAQRRRCRNMRTDTHAFDGNSPTFAIGDEQVEQHVPCRFGKQAVGKITGTQPPLIIKRPCRFDQRMRRYRPFGHPHRIQPRADRRGRLSDRAPRAADRSSGPGTSHCPSGLIISSGGRPMRITSLAGGMAASIST